MPQRTYSHLLHLGRMPTEYELLTSKLLYHSAADADVHTPLRDWYQRHQRRSPFVCSDWEKFRDPAETTYFAYTSRQTTREIFVDGLLASIDESAYDEHLPARWIEVLEELLAVLRYPFHGMQMISAYVGQMAPSGRIVVAALFQSADEMRRIQRIAQRIAQLRRAHPAFARDSRSRWQEAAVFQPLRRVIEELLVTYDWGEAFVALNLCVKPLIDDLLVTELGELARREGDYLLREILRSLDEDCRWHRDWSQALAGVALADDPSNLAVLHAWVAKWGPRTDRAIAAFENTMGADAIGRVRARHREGLRQLGVDAQHES